MTDEPTDGLAIPPMLQRKRTEYEPHPLALMFPPMVEPEFNELVEDIRKHGQLEPIRLYQGKILDGRNRCAACQQLRKEVWAEEYQGDDPKGYVIAMNRRC